MADSEACICELGRLRGDCPVHADQIASSIRHSIGIQTKTLRELRLERALKTFMEATCTVAGSAVREATAQAREALKD